MAQAPAPLPSWMLNLSQQEQQYGPLSPGYRPAGLGYAEMDQYSGGGIPPSGSMGEQILNGHQGLTSIDPQGYAVMGSDPSGFDRTGRAVKGFFTGYDTGNAIGNAGLQAGSAFVPGGMLANGAAGAIQGATSDAKVFNKMLPEGGNQSPGFGSPDVMPRGIYGGGLLEQPAQNPLQSGGGGGGYTQAAPGAAGFAANPIESRPKVPGQLPDLQTLLAQAQRYGDPDGMRTGYAGSASGAGGYQYGGFDFAQDPANRDIGKSAKYAFSQFAEEAARAGAPMPRTKPEAEAWFNQHIAPKLQQAGYPVEWVQGDKARIRVREGVDEIDFLGDAGGANPTLTWQSEVLAPGGGMSTGPAAGGGAPTSGMDLTSSALFEQLMQQVRDIAAGKTSGALVTDTNALLNLLTKGS
jgi:hypothetical protein